MLVLRFAGQREPSPDRAAELRDDNRATRDHLPSWAPNWAIPLEASVLEHRKHRYDYRASPSNNHRRMRFSDQDPDTLLCVGTALDTITALIDISATEEVSSQRFPFEEALQVAQHTAPRGVY